MLDDDHLSMFALNEALPDEVVEKTEQPRIESFDVQESTDPPNTNPILSRTRVLASCLAE